MKPFKHLTHRGQARRLRRMAIRALDHYPFEVEKIRLLSYSFNCIFRVDTAGGQKFVLRINIPGIRSIDEIRSESQWLAALRRDTGLVVPEPLLNREGRLVTTVDTPGIPEPRHCVIFGWVNGVNLYEKMTRENYRKLGAFTAQLHQHAGSWQPPADFSLRTHDDVYFIDRDKGNLWETDAPELMPAGRAEVFRSVYEQAETVFGQIYGQPEPPRVLHADLHQANVRLFRGRMRALDFDDCLLGHCVQDVGITFYYLQGHEDYEGMREAYRQGYESRQPWPETAAGQIETVIAAREMQLSQHLYFGNNPSYKPILPKFFARAEDRLRKYLENHD